MMIRDSHTIKKIPFAKMQNERVLQIVQSSLSTTPKLNIERARYFTQSLKQNENLPLVLRWARGIVHVMENMQIHILPNELIVGRFGSEGRYGVFYPELEGSFFVLDKKEFSKSGMEQYFSEEDSRIIKEELLPYWKGRTYREGITKKLPKKIKKLMYSNEKDFSSSFIIQETASLRHSLQWVLDYEKVLQHGFVAIEEEARKHLLMLSEDDREKQAYYKAVIELCLGIKNFSQRYASYAEKLAKQEANTSRKEELLEIAERCKTVPYYPARTFVEAVQSQWFVQFISRIEQLHGANISNGRLDQYLYPFYKKDREKNLISDEEVKEILLHLWCNMSQILRLQTTPGGEKIYENSAHWESTTIGGLDREGRDATNPLSLLVLETSAAFPLDYPYLCARIHKNTPESFLISIAKSLRMGKDIPILINDEEIIPLLTAHNVSKNEALDYAPSGYSEVRLVNKNTYLTGGTWLNLVAVLEMALSSGRCSSSPHESVGLKTGDSSKFESFEDVKAAFFKQLAYLQEAIYTQQFIADEIRKDYFAFPLLSSLHSLCMKHGMEITSGEVPESLNLGGITGITGLATVVDSLAVIKKIVFDEKIISIKELLNVIATNFEGNEALRQLCLHVPKYGTGDLLTIELAKEIDYVLVSSCQKRKNYYNGTPQVFYVPITAHTAMGRISGATADGRRAGEELSCGTASSKGSAVHGPTVLLASEKAAKNPQLQSLGARVIELSLCPRTVHGQTGVDMLCKLIRAWCEQKHWYLRIHIQDQKDMALLKNNPEKFRDMVVREVGLNGSASSMSSSIINQMFSLGKANELIARTNKQDEQDEKAKGGMYHA